MTITPPTQGRRNRFLPATSLAAAAALAALLAFAGPSPAAPAEESAPAAADPNAPQVPVVDGIVQPRRPITDAIADAMAFFKKSDGDYVPGHIDDPDKLAGYFTRAHVKTDGSPSTRYKFCFPGRQHAYFINTFLLYGKYTGQPEWLQRAKDLADWNLAHSTPSDAFYPNIPWSVWTDGHPGGSGDKDSLEPDKAAFLATSYLSLYDATHDARYLDGAKAVAKTLATRQGDDGSWPFRVLPTDGTVRQQFGGAPVFYVDFFERILKYDNDPAYQKAYDRALKLMLDRNVEQNLWGTYHEDIKNKPDNYLSAEPMSFTAIYLFTHAKAHPEYVDYGRKILAAMEAKLVHTTGHPAAPAPAVSEQQGFQHMMPGHTARYCLALTDLYAATGDQQAKRTALSGFNALTYMQSDAGLFRTMFQLVHEKKARPNREDWYSQHLYTVCHVLEAMPILPELKAEGK
jgi:hypothetical protein